MLVDNFPDSVSLICRGVSTTCDMTHTVFLGIFLQLFYFKSTWDVWDIFCIFFRLFTDCTRVRKKVRERK